MRTVHETCCWRLAAVGCAGSCRPCPAATAPDPDDVADVSGCRVLQKPERLPLPLERIRPALTAHLRAGQGPVYWVGTGRMTPFLQRLADAADDGLNPADYPIDALIELRDADRAG